MISLSLSALAGILDSKLCGADAIFSGVSTDTRSLSQGQLFVALNGPNFNAHDYLEVALEKGAAGAVVESSTSLGLPHLVVPDTQRALAKIAHTWREKFEGILIGITGSAGKTTVKEMAASVFRQFGKTLATHGNLNNEIGVPLTLFELNPEHRFALIEMGANGRGDIAYLAQIARPDIGIVTCAAPAHLDGFGDLKTIAETKGELFSSLTDCGTAVVNADDQFADLWKNLAGSSDVVTFGQQGDVSARNIALDPEGIEFDLCIEDRDWPVRLSYAGRHNVFNALAVCAAAFALNLDMSKVVQGLSLARPVSGRLHFLQLANGARLIDDSYNANPASVEAAIDVLASHQGEQWLVLGTMAELGQASSEFHAAAGRAAARAGISRLFTVGEWSDEAARAFGDGATHFASVDAVLPAVSDAIARHAGSDLCILVKGSRVVELDKLVDALTREATGKC